MLLKEEVNIVKFAQTPSEFICELAKALCLLQSVLVHNP